MDNTRRGMIKLGLGSVALAFSAAGSTIAIADEAEVPRSGACAPLLDYSLRPLMGDEPVRLCREYSREVLLLVNTASKCGFTPQFEGLETLHGRYQKDGFQVLGFPSGDFRQELADEAAVADFCKLNYGVSFPMFQKIHVREGQAHPLYNALAANGNGYPDWNFHKYLVSRDGRVLGHFGSREAPLGERLTAAIESALQG